MKNIMPLEGACKSFEEDLVLFYYGECGDADRLRVERHLLDCGGCRSFVDDLSRLLPAMATSEELPQSFWDAYYRDTLAKLAEQESRRHWWRDLLAPLKVWMLPAFGTAAVAVLAIGLVFGKGDSKRTDDRSTEPIPQAIMADANQLEFFESMDLLESLSKLEAQDEQTVDPTANQSSNVSLIGANA
jgi:hypothetical protein